MKNRLLWLLIISIFVFVGFIYLINREISEKKSEKNIINNSWILEENKIIFKKIEEEKQSASWLEIENNSWTLEEKGDHFAYFLVNSEKFFFDIVWEKLELKNGENSLWFFDVVLKNDLKISEIFSEKKLFLIEIWEKKYIYSKENWFLKDFETKLQISYWKISDWNFLFFSEGKWIFVLYKEKNELEYLSLFTDFIFYKNWYIWIISENDTEKKSRFWLSWKNIVFYFEPKTWEKKIIYDLEFFPKKIWEENSKIFLENDKNEKFILENY